MNQPPDEFEGHLNRFDALAERMKPKLLELLAARREFYRTGTEESRIAFDSVQAEALSLSQEYEGLVAELPQLTGLSADAIAEQMRVLEEDRASKFGDGIDRLPRESLTDELVEVTGDIDSMLANAIDYAKTLLPKDWLDEEPTIKTQLGDLARPGSFLSLTKGMRVESEQNPVHRLRQMIRVSEDYLRQNLFYDHFAGATLVPTLVQFASQADALAVVGGERRERERRLWRGTSEQVDATMFELLTAAACARFGRGMEFLPETHEKTADLRAHDPYPLLIECKHQDPFTDYELREEPLMRRLFLMLRQASQQLRLYGTFILTLSVEASQLDLDEVVSKLVGQRFAPFPQRRQTYAWGSVQLSPASAIVHLRQETRIYSPSMLAFLFGWSSDLPNADGLCCSIETNGEPRVDIARSPIGLVWQNESEAALKKRTWAPSNLFGAASKQIPDGEFAIIYVGYVEGGRAQIADLRLGAFAGRLKEFDQSARIRIPVAFLSRLYPRALGEGRPDLIESAVRYLSAEHGDPGLFEKFPTGVFSGTT